MSKDDSARSWLSAGGSSLVGRIGGPVALLAVLLVWRPDSTAVPDADPWTMSVVAGVTVLMAIWWMTEALPLPATSLVPILLLPLLSNGQLSIASVTASYGNWRVYLFLGGFLIAIAMEVCGLHRRIALWIIELIGASPRRVVLGFMVATAFLSMWISNTATALMMLPIGIAVIDHFHGRRQFAISLMLGIAYGASIGGIGTIIGTPPNIAFLGVVGEMFPEAPEITFTAWMALALPLVIVFLPIAWLILVSRLPHGVGNASDAIARERKGLGPMSAEEQRVLIVFVVAALLWVFRRPIDVDVFRIPGWSEIPGFGAANDGTVALAMGLSLFLIPARTKPGFLLSWEPVHEKMPWGILLLFGGGFALADAIFGSGLSAYVGSRFGFLAGLHPFLLMAAAAAMLTFLTEITSNTATAQVTLPIFAGIATHTIHADPLVLMVPVTMAASCAFMLPVATPPNAVIFGSGRVPMGEMIRYGLVLNLIGILLVTLVCYFLLPAIFGVRFESGVPPWAVG